MSDSIADSKTNFRWHITIGCTFVFSLIGFAFGWSVDTKHPDDRLADILIPTLAFFTAGLLVGYMTSLVLYRRLKWFDALVSFSIPILLFLVASKIVNKSIGALLGIVAFACFLFVVARFVSIYNHRLNSKTVESD